MSMFNKATRAAKKWKILFRGTSGSGKTYSALLIAKGLAQGGKIAVVDTEKLSSTHLSDKVDFDVLDFNDEFEGNHYYKNYLSIIDEASKAGYKVLIIDSFSHAWMGQGGILQVVDALAESKYKNNSYAAWKDGTEIYNQLIEKILFNNDMHILLTARTKTEYVQDRDETGKTRIHKVGMKSEQRDGLDYEFDVVLNFDTSKPGYAIKDKDRTGIFLEEGEMITEKTAKKLIAYNEGRPEIIVKEKIVTEEEKEEVIEKRKQEKEVLEEKIIEKVKSNVKKQRVSSMNDELKKDVEVEKSSDSFEDTFIKIKEYIEQYELMKDEKSKQKFIKMMTGAGLTIPQMKLLIKSDFGEELAKTLSHEALRELQLNIEQSYIWGPENAKMVEEILEVK